MPICTRLWVTKMSPPFSEKKLQRRKSCLSWCVAETFSQPNEICGSEKSCEMRWMWFLKVLIRWWWLFLHLKAGQASLFVSIFFYLQYILCPSTCLLVKQQAIFCNLLCNASMVSVVVLISQWICCIQDIDSNNYLLSGTLLEKWKRGNTSKDN